MLANTTGSALTKAGENSWVFLTADYAFGQALEKDTAAAVERNGGKVVGRIRHPLNTEDFSSWLLQAQNSGAKVVGLANSGGDTTSAIRQAADFGLSTGGQKIAALLLRVGDVDRLGLVVSQGLTVTETFYWDLNDQTRAFSDRFAKRMATGVKPSMTHAGVYAGTIHYLKAVEALGDASDGARVVAKMKEIPTDDALLGKGSIRADGRKIHPAFIFEVKKPSESSGRWDYYKLVTTVPADQAFRPFGESECPLLKN